MQKLIVISKPSAAAVFASARQRKIVQTLISEELTLGALSRATQTPLNLLLYHVAKCIGLGLIEIVRHQRRAGRAVKYYRATAKTFFVPAELIAEMPGTGLTEQLRMSLDRCLSNSLEGINFTHDGRTPRAHLVKDSLKSIPIELWLDVGLGSADAEQLAVELQSVVDRFRARGNKRQPRHLVHLAAVRVETRR
jgi:hypothetical protein